MEWHNSPAGAFREGLEIQRQGKRLSFAPYWVAACLRGAPYGAAGVPRNRHTNH